MQGNPLAINPAEWMALVRYLISSVKHWLFDRHRLRLEHLSAVNEKGWDELETNGAKLLESVAFRHSEVILLGGQA